MKDVSRGAWNKKDEKHDEKESGCHQRPSVELVECKKKMMQRLRRTGIILYPWYESIMTVEESQENRTTLLSHALM